MIGPRLVGGGVVQVVDTFGGWEHDLSLPFTRALSAFLEDRIPTGADDELRRRLLSKLGMIVVGDTGVFGVECDVALEPFGSYVMGLGSSSSDLDLSLEGTVRATPCQDLSKTKKRDLLQVLAKEVRRRKISNNVQKILHARVPIIKFVDRETGVQCDMCIGNNGALYKSRVLSLVNDMDPRYHALLTTVKSWAKVRGLNDPAGGTLNSFCISLLVALHLQTRDPPVLPPFKDLLLLEQEGRGDPARPEHRGRVLNDLEGERRRDPCSQTLRHAASVPSPPPYEREWGSHPLI